MGSSANRSLDGKSLLTGKNTGKFTNLALNLAVGPLYPDQSKRIPTQLIPIRYRAEQGIITRISGKLHSLITQRLRSPRLVNRF